jgi:hypothetical protein
VPEPEGFSADPDAAAATLLAAVTSGLSMAREPRAVRQQFEEDLRGVVRARSVSVGPSSGAPPQRPDVLTFDVPAGPWAPPARLEATFEPSRPVCEWQRRTLALAAPLAALIVRMDEGGPWSRLSRIDGAAPLIGSSQAIRRVRERIERVAVTDFTALIAGQVEGAVVAAEMIDASEIACTTRTRGVFLLQEEVIRVR